MPSLEVAHRIADALSCSLDDVFRYASELPVQDEDDEPVWVDSAYKGPSWQERSRWSELTAG